MTKEEQIEIINSENVEFKRENTSTWYNVNEYHNYDFVHNEYRIKGTELDKSVENYLDSTTNKTYRNSYISGALFVMDKIKEIDSDEEMPIEDKYSMILQFVEDNYREL